MSKNTDKVDENTWKKVEDAALKAGFRDGISDGRDSNFQNSFDDGYKRGFDAGFTLGVYKGTLSFQKDLKATPVLNLTTRGNCQMCTNTNLENDVIPTLDRIQEQSLQDILIKLKEDYPKINI